MTDIPAGMQAGYIAVEASSCGEDLTYWVLTQTQMDEVDLAGKASNDYCEIMGNLAEAHNLEAAQHDTIKEALAYMAKENLFLVEDFNYVGY